MKKYYLGRKGKIFGPYTEAEYENLLASGEIENFRYLWNAKNQDWIPLEPAPAQTPEAYDLGSKVSHSAKPQVSNPLWQAVCHDLKTAVKGLVGQVTETGCMIYSDSTESLKKGSKILLHLFDPKLQKSIQIRAVLSEVQRQNAGWSYQIRWNESPKFS
ncbi:MAG: hypothetical protein CL678_14845 [Bdellovibrionaceae bacterium]|nr:hypothetical protein [Pseudobdellovibrionaceae bacterium]